MRDIAGFKFSDFTFETVPERALWGPLFPLEELEVSRSSPSLRTTAVALEAVCMSQHADLR